MPSDDALKGQNIVADGNAQCHQNKEIFMLFCTTFPREPCYEQHFLATSHKVVVKFPNSMQLPSEFDSKTTNSPPLYEKLHFL